MRRSGLAWTAASAGFGAGLLLLAAVASTAALPGVGAAGMRVVLAAVLASLGTGAGPLLPLAALGGAFGLAWTLSGRGECTAAQALGLGPIRLLATQAPVLATAAAACLGLGLLGEPAAWREVHRLRGSPLAAATAWAGLDRGDVRVIGGGGAIVVRDGGLRFGLAGHGISGQAESVEPLPGTASWRLAGFRLDLPGSGTWEAGAVVIQPDREKLERWLAPPQGPRTLGPLRLLRAARSDQRAAMVWHRRLAQAAAVPLLALAGWLMGWAPPGRRRGAAAWRGAAAVGLALGLLAASRTADHAATAGLVGGATGGWLPFALLLATVALLLAARTAR